MVFVDNALGLGYLEPVFGPMLQDGLGRFLMGVLIE